MRSKIETSFPLFTPANWLSTLLIGVLLPLSIVSSTLSQDASPDDTKVSPSQNATFSNLPPETGLRGIYVPDFSYAGYGYGIEDIPNFSDAPKIDVRAYGVVADDHKDDSAALLSALDAANRIDGPVIVSFPAGRTLLSEIIPITRSDIVLRGTGEAATELHFPRPLSMVDTKGKFDEIHDYLIRFNKVQREPDRNIDLQFSDYSWTGGFLWIGPQDYRAAAYLEELDKPDQILAEGLSGGRGQFHLAVETTDKLLVGDDIEVVWYSREGPEGGIIDELYGDTDLDVGSHHWSFPNRGLVRQRTEIAAISGNVVTLRDPLLHPVSNNVPASIVGWVPLHNVGVEDLSITFPTGVSFGHHLEQGFNGIYFAGAMHSWVRDVTIRDADAGILSYGSANLTIDNVTTTGNRVAHYSVHAGNVHNVLVSDLSVQNRVRHALTVNTQSTKTVFLRSEVFHQPTLDQHAGSNHQNLFDQTVFHLDAERSENGPSYPVWDGSGAGYWQPGHGRFNTTYNLELRVKSGANRNETLIAEGIAEGPEARLIGIWGNRPVSLDYRPKPVTALTGKEPTVPSLYEWQKDRRLAKQTP